MRIVFNKHVFGWKMTGFIGAYGKWFLGFSLHPYLPKQGKRDKA